MEFFYPLLNFLQAGVLIPALAPFKPMLLASIVAGLYGFARSKKADASLRREYITHPVFIWLCVFMFIQVISVYRSGLHSMFEELDYWNVYPLFVLVSLLTIYDARSLRRYVWGMMLGTGFVVVFGLVAVALHFPTIVGGRAGAYGMYENHNDYTFAIIMVLPYIYLSGRLCHSKLAKLLLLGLLGSCVLGVLMSLSRGGILALVLEFALMFWFTLSGKRRVLAFIVVGVIGSGAIVWQFAARAENQQGNYTEADAENSRYELWRAAKNMFVAHPVLGIGSRRFHEYSQDYGEISHDNRGKVAHNTYIEIAADTGLFGITTFMLMLFGVYRSVRAARIPLARGDGIVEMQLATLVGLLSIMFRSLLDAKAHDWSFYVLAVLAIATSTLAAKASPVDEEAGSPGTSAAPIRRGAARPMIYGQSHQTQRRA